MSARRIAAFLGLCVLIVGARVTWDASSNYADGRNLEAQGQYHEAAIHYGRAIHMYLPGLPTPHRASRHLVELAARARETSDKAEERFCWEELRSGWLAVRSTWQPGSEWIALADDGIARLVLEAEGATWPNPTLAPEAREAEVRARLAAREDPATGWVLVMGLGWLLWLGAATAALWRGIPAEDTAAVRVSVLLRWGAVSLVGYGLWLLGLWQA